MTGRGKITIRDPAEAVALAKCWLSTWTKATGSELGYDVNSIHPAICDWCDYPRDLLIKALEEFGDWAGLFKEEPELRAELEAFDTIPRDEQSRLVVKAQGYEGKVAADMLHEDHLKQKLKPILDNWWSD